MNTQIIAIANQKGGVGKTTTCANLGIGLAQSGKKVLLIDGDPQGSLTISLGNPQPDKLPFTLSDAMGRILMDEPLRPGEGILHHPEGVDLMPADIQLSGMEVSLVNAMSRETVLRQYLDTLKGQYSHILIDCQPSLGMLTVNALAAANRIIIPVQAEYLPAKGLEQLLSTVNKVKRQINPKLQIDGILLTMVDSRTNFAKEISALLRETYGSKIKVFGTEIPHSVRAKEISAEGKSIFAHDPGGKVAEGYKNLTKEVLKLEKQREKNRAAAHKSTRYYIDEMHLLLKEEQTAAYTVEIWKRFRKWGGIPTGITQNVKDLLSSREVENIFENSDFVYMLNQAGGDRQILAKQLGISTHQLSYVTHSGEGEGLLFYGSTILPFVDHFPKNTELYRIMTTKPQELKKKEDE